MATPHAPGSPAASRTSTSISGLAIAGLVLAFLLAPLGLILSAVALGEIGKSGGRKTGRGLAIAGLVIGILMTLVSLLAAIAIPSFLAYMKKSKYSEVRLNLRHIERAAKTYYITNGAFPDKVAPLTPSTPCCATPTHYCTDTREFVESPAWQDLDFAPYDRTRFRYSFTSKPGHFEATAVGAADCGDAEQTYRLIIDAPNGNPTARYEEPTQ